AACSVRTARKKPQRNSHRARRRQTRYTRAKTVPPASYHVGQAVLTRTHPPPRAATGYHAGFTTRWGGPHRVVDITGPDTYRVPRNGTLT
ncbi:hypothetical protein CBL_21079, partial [Carabus blaptoides fortunei]